MTVEEITNLKLIGENEEDLKVISAYLQDSIAKVKDIVFLKQNRIFIMIVNRFMWEDAEKDVLRKNKRIKCALKFEEVIAARSLNINQRKKNKFLECLAIKCDLTFKENYKIRIFFSGNSIITIIAEVIDVSMQDIGKSWNVNSVPTHKI